MPKISHTGPIAAPILALIALVALVACGGGRDDAPTFIPPTATSAAVAGTAVPVATLVPAATTVAPTQAPVPTSVPAATVAPTTAPATAPTATTAPEPTPTPSLPTSFEEFGFKLTLDRGADVRTAGSPTVQQGAVTFAYGAVNSVLTWTPQGDTALFALIDGTYGFVQDAQQGLTFETLIDGELSADSQLGVFLGFKAVDASGNASGGLIGAWTCPASETSFTLTLTGDNTALVQVRFDEVIDGFGCSAS